jgi:hypothetical protein
MEKRQPLTNVVGKTGYLHVEDKLDPCLPLCTYIKVIKNLKVRLETLILLQERMGNTGNI